MSQVVPGLLMVMDDVDNPRVQAHAGAALVNFSEDCPKSILIQYLDPIIVKLEQVLNLRFKEVRQPRARGRIQATSYCGTPLAGCAYSCWRRARSWCLQLLVLTVCTVYCVAVCCVLCCCVAVYHVDRTGSLCLQLLEKGTKLVLEQVVTTLASVADTAEEKFLVYYDRSAVHLPPVCPPPVCPPPPPVRPLVSPCSHTWSLSQRECRRVLAGSFHT